MSIISPALIAVKLVNPLIILQWKCKEELAGVVIVILYPYPSAMPVNEFFAEKEPEDRPLFLIIAGEKVHI
jgi:hypothetical protein